MYASKHKFRRRMWTVCYHNTAVTEAAPKPRHFYLFYYRFLLFLNSIFFYILISLMISTCVCLCSLILVTVSVVLY